MKRAYLILLLLTACQQQPDRVGREEFERLQTRVSQLEMAATKPETEKVVEAPRISPPPKPVEAKPRYTHQLIGTSYKEEGKHLYTSEGKCEAARSTLLDAWKNADSQEKYLVIKNRPTPTCLPI